MRDEQMMTMFATYYRIADDFYERNEKDIRADEKDFKMALFLNDLKDHINNYSKEKNYDSVVFIIYCNLFITLLKEYMNNITAKQMLVLIGRE